MNLGCSCGTIAPSFSHLFDAIAVVPNDPMMGSFNREEFIEPKMHLWKRLTKRGNAIVAMFVKACHDEKIGVVGFDPTVSWSRTMRFTRLSYTPD